MDQVADLEENTEEIAACQAKALATEQQDSNHAELGKLNLPGSRGMELQSTTAPFQARSTTLTYEYG